MSVRIDAAELTFVAERFQAAADNIENLVGEPFNAWVDETYETMREETPVDEGELRDSIEVERSGLEAKITPTKRVAGAGGSDHGLAFLLEHGVGDRPPDPFISRTAERARESAPQVNITDLL